MNLYTLGSNVEGREAPTFHSFTILDVNPLSGHTKNRLLFAPNEEMRRVHRRVVRRLRSIRYPQPYATACLAGSSPRRNVERHRGHRYFYLLDLHRAYENVNQRQLAKVLRRIDKTLGTEQEVFEFLQRYCLLPRRGLITGAPASPDLFNLYATVRIDEVLAPLCERYGITYTRYLDDLTFSSNEPIGQKKRRAIRAVIIDAGFTISWRKAQVCDLTKGAITINGIGLDANGRIFVPRSFNDRIDALLHRAKTRGDVDLATINGFMGIFKSSTPEFSSQRNATEAKTLKRYAQALPHARRRPSFPKATAKSQLRRRNAA